MTTDRVDLDTALATRYDKRAQSYRALWVIAMTMLWIKHDH